MSPQTALAPTDTPLRIEQGWLLAMPNEIAVDLFGLPEGTLVTLLARPGEITALMNLAPQTEAAKRREPGWILRMPPDIAAATGSAEGSLIVIYAKAGAARAEIIAPRPEIRAAARRYFEEYGPAAEELA